MVDAMVIGGIAILLICCCCFCCLLLGGGGGAYVLNTPTLSGQKLQDTALEIGGPAPIILTNKPTGYATQTSNVSYTMSMDVYCEKAAGSWRNILEHGTNDSVGDFPPGTAYRRPSFYIAGNDSGANAGKFHICHGDTNGAQAAILSKNPITYGKWTNQTWVVNNNVLTSYTDGVLDQTVTPTGTGKFNWFATDQPWVWNRLNYATNNSGSMKVRNAYFWPSALTVDQIAKFKASAT